MLPEVVASLFGMKDQYLAAIAATASRINIRNASIFDYCLWLLNMV
jgi:hypothetical protein